MPEVEASKVAIVWRSDADARRAATPSIAAELLDRSSLPIIRAADFIYGRRPPTGNNSYVFCEISVISGFAITH